jgi:hypothetical protein
MNALARTYSLKEIEADLSIVEDATKECASCDPDSPKAVPRSKCKVCGGTGRQKLAAIAILKELNSSEAEEEDQIPEGDEYEEDEYLEY